MTRDQIETLQNLGDAGYRQMRELNTLNLEAWSELAAHQRGLFELLLDSGRRQSGRLTEALEDPSRLFQEQIQSGRDLTDALAEHNREWLVRSRDIGHRYLELAEQGTRRAAEALNPREDT